MTKEQFEIKLKELRLFNEVSIKTTLGTKEDEYYLIRRILASSDSKTLYEPNIFFKLERTIDLESDYARISELVEQMCVEYPRENRLLVASTREYGVSDVYRIPNREMWADTCKLLVHKELSDVLPDLGWPKPEIDFDLDEIDDLPESLKCHATRIFEDHSRSLLLWKIVEDKKILLEKALNGDVLAASEVILDNVFGDHGDYPTKFEIVYIK